MKPALYRSVWFWLGCFVLGFLVWAWADSRTRRISASRILSTDSPAMRMGELPAHYTEEFSVDSGRIFATWTRIVRKGPGLRMNEMFSGVTDGPPKFGGEWLVMPTAKRYEDKPMPGATVMVYRVEVPMWVIVGLYVMMCGGVMVWRGRRWRRLASEGRVM